MNKEIESILATEHKDPAYGKCVDYQKKISELVTSLNSFRDKYKAEVERQKVLATNRQKVIASTPKPDPNPKSKG